MATSNIALSRGVPTLPITRTTRATIHGVASARVNTSLTLPSSSLFYTGPKPLVALKRSVIRCSAPEGPTPDRTTILSGDRLPDATLHYVEEDGKLGRTTTVAEFTAGKNILLLAAGTMLKKKNLVLADKFKIASKDLLRLADTIACVTWLPEEALEKSFANDEALKADFSAKIFKVWWNIMVGRDRMVLLADKSGEFMKALGESRLPLKLTAADGVAKLVREFHLDSSGNAAAAQKMKFVQMVMEKMQEVTQEAKSHRPADEKKNYIPRVFKHQFDSETRDRDIDDKVLEDFADKMTNLTGELDKLSEEDKSLLIDSLRDGILPDLF